MATASEPPVIVLLRVGSLRRGRPARLREGMAVGEAIAAVYEACAALHGKPRWGDKTPMYMQYLGSCAGSSPPRASSI
jgi:hypothetical protein